MTKTFCDVCEKEAKTTIRVRFLDGEHPHNGSTMYRHTDVCFKCLEKHTQENGVLRSDLEFDYFVGVVKK